MHQIDCVVCHKSFKSKKIRIYCSLKCLGKQKRQKKIDKWMSGEITGLKVGCRIIRSIRMYLLEKANYACKRCGWDKKNPVTGVCPLEINHIDGNANNNIPSNLEVICPNCHSLTPTWKALNKGNGSKERHRYSGLIK